MRDPGSKLARALIALACLLAYAGTLRIAEFVHDDRFLIAENPLLHLGLRGAPRLFSTGLWEAVQGTSAPVQLYRPVLMLSFLLQTLATGFDARPMHGVNLLLHVLVCLLLYEVLRDKTSPAAALAAALIFAVLPVHAEAVCSLNARSELLSAAFLLGSWLCLDGGPGTGRLAGGALLFMAALLSKESSALFPVFLALSDRTFHHRKPWGPQGRRVHAALGLACAAYFLARFRVLSHAMNGGLPYFSSGRLVAALTMSRFAALHYAWPSVSGAGLCSDFSRPLIPDSTLTSPGSWLALAALTSLVGAAILALARRREHWAFWLLGPSLFLLPTCNLLIANNTIGAERWLYFPTIGLAAALGIFFARLEKSWGRTAWLPAAALLGWYAFACVRRCETWTTSISYYQAAVTCNPVSARPRASLGLALVLAGNHDLGRANLLKATELDPNFSNAYYNLGKLAWEEKNPAEAERFLRKALESNQRTPNTWVLLATILQSQKRMDEARACLRKAQELRLKAPGSP